MGRKLTAVLAASFIIICCLQLTACGDKDKIAVPESPYAGREAADLSGYPSMYDSGAASRLVDTSVAEIDQLMSDKESFVFLAAYEDCDYCNLLIPYLNDALADADTYAGYLDTRKDPGWMNNSDIDDYDLFVKRFGRYLEKNENGDRYLYTPDLYVIKNGKVKAHHQGVIGGVDDPSQPLDAAQEKELRDLLADMISELR